jgi:hypothetical protein
LVNLPRRALMMLLICAVAPAAPAAAATAYVHFGAILLGEAPTANHDARRPRVGYLPIGTRVYFDPQVPKQRIFNYSEDVQDYEYYIRVRSDIGFSGYVRDDLITELGDTDILLPLRYNLNIRAMDSSEVVAQISRAEDKNSSMPAEILHEAEEYFAVRALLPGREPVEGRIWKSLVDGRRALKLSKRDHPSPPEIHVGSPAQFIERQLVDFSEFVSEKTGEATTRVVEFLQNMNALRCRISSSADAQLSAKIFGNGLGLRFNFVLAERNAIYSIKSLSYSRDGSNYSSYYELRDVRCVDGIPHRLANLILLKADDPSQQIIVSREDLPQTLKGNWARFETARSEKMIIIDGIGAYEEFMRHIGGSALLQELPHGDSLILSHALLRELAHFSTPD